MDKFIAHILVVDDDEGIRSLVKKYLDENNYLIIIQTEEGYGIYSSSYGGILIPAYNSIKSFNLNGRYYFLAKREISEANLLINLLINEKGEIILNQALNFNDLSLVFCD